MGDLGGEARVLENCKSVKQVGRKHEGGEGGNMDKDRCPGTGGIVGVAVCGQPGKRRWDKNVRDVTGCAARFTLGSGHDVRGLNFLMTGLI